MKYTLFALLALLPFCNYAQITEQTDRAIVDSTIRQGWAGEITRSKDLPYPYIGAFRGAPFMFYWDTYFINKGLLIQGKDSIARNNTLNLLTIVDKFGFMGNAAITAWGMNRSQPPFLSAMVWDIFEKSGKTDTSFLRYAYPILKKEYEFWLNSHGNSIELHSTSIKGLQRYGSHATKDELLVLYQQLASRFKLTKNFTDEQKIKMAYPFAVEAATGMDFTPRFEHRCPDFAALDLNCLLYTYEVNFSKMADILNILPEPDWKQLARARKRLINQYCWDTKRGVYADYDFINKRPGSLAAVTTMFPLWAGIASKKQAAAVAGNISRFMSSWGLTTVEKTNKETTYQWGPTSVWAPMQMIAVSGLDNYGYTQRAKKIAGQYVDLITKNYFHPVPEYIGKPGGRSKRKVGSIYEKYKADGTINDDEYPASVMFGWTAATFAYCYNYLNVKK